ncbi:DUF1566 domain-containing protein [Seonamhaeicola marinus]|uniref:DUF1566 domain-containing protein n=1 Tax=Seonamhaeicola marinus TaxID=1912246 RepID=A0A5D0IKS9_9FLAO|nr:DUF1566 domain-containing protein [Seonamhaeicola marinus]TYA84415.1 DUF1566 domain-containing protein [Seonamhaeicola marinus]
MKKATKFIKMLFITVLMISYSCSDDDAPQINLEDLQATIDENPTNGQVIGTIQSNTNNVLTFSIISQTPNGAIAINENTGELIVADATVFDFETNPIITAVVEADGAENNANVTINVTNVNELSIQDFTTTIDENPTDGDVLGTIQAAGDGTLSFSIISQTPTGAMSIDANTGELSVSNPNLFDYETNTVLTATIEVNNTISTQTATATINLNDVDEVTAQQTNMTIDENPSNDDVVGTLTASGSNLTYTITFQNPAGAFDINQSTGELTVANASLFDYETNPNMLATISVSNGTQTVSANALVALNDIHEIGDFKFGGVIFWIDPASNNSKGLVVATSSQPDGAWGCSGTSISGANGQAIGDGELNTTAIETSCSTAGTAADIVSNLNLNSYNDWFLPSMNEANEIYLNLTEVNAGITANGGVTISPNNSYWTSTETSTTLARFIGMSNGSLNSVNKNASLQVRAIRTWTDF